ncbi:MAG TPA: flagellar hook-length control protein FliK, partial [candidate division Zixibacteria bacterium]|nr:flagellar hook-length control protein FliK [candidate division Zixibacteria bacterium]
AVLDESGVFDEKIIVNNNQSDKLIEKASFDTKGQVAKSKQNISQQIGSQVKSDVLNQPVERTDSVMYSYNTDKIDRAAVKENMQNVRMQLPENINSALRPNGQAVVIKMNPENLGPAKLSLSFSGGKLRAKLSVTSLNAKHVLDHSLNRLVDQLHKIDINVDKFDVTLDQNQNKNEQFNQQQQWQRKMSYKNIDLEQFNQNELEQTVQQPILSAAQQVLSGSVNYLA